MRSINTILLSLLTILLFQACVIEERYHFHEDMSGQYIMTFDYSRFAEEDSSGEMKASMDLMLDSIYDEVKFVKGISNAKKESEGYGFTLSYDFDNVATLNQVEAMDAESEKNSEVFKLIGKRLQFRPDLEELKSSLSEDGDTEGDESPEDAEMAESLGKMFIVRTIISFDKDVKVKEMKYFRETEKNSFEYDSEKDGFDVQPVLDVKL